MEQDRRIRFVIPPFILVGAILLASYFVGDKCDWWRHFKAALVAASTESDGDHDQIVKLIGLLLAGGTAVIAVGYLLSTISIFFKYLLGFIVSFCMSVFCCRRRSVHLDACVSRKSLNSIRKLIKTANTSTRSSLFHAGTFDHGMIRNQAPGLSDWLRRRWTTHNVAMHSFVGLVLLLSLGPNLGLFHDRRWVTPVAVAASFLLIQSIIAWLETMKMVEFLSQLEWDKISWIKVKKDSDSS